MLFREISTHFKHFFHNFLGFKRIFFYLCSKMPYTIKIC